MEQNNMIVNGMIEIESGMVEQAEEYLRQHGVEDPATVLQGLGYILLDTNLYPGT